MKPLVTGMVLIALFTNVFCYAQNDTPMEVLVNIANEHSRFVPQQIFIKDHRNTDYLATYLEHFTALKLNEPLLKEIVSKGQPNIAVSIPLPDGKSLTAKMVNFDIRTEGFSVVNEKEMELEIPDAQFYRGILEREIDATAGMSFFEDEVYGLFSSIGKGNIVLAKDPIQPGNGENYIVYFEKDLLIARNAECGAEEIDLFQESQSVSTRSTSNVYSSCEDIEIYIEATNKLYNSKGSTSATTNYISAFFNNVSIIYRNEGIYTSLNQIKINSSSDSYTALTTAFDKLNKFGENTQNNYRQHGAKLAHLVDYNTSGLGGIAWIGSLCSNYFKYEPPVTPETYHTGGYAYSSINNTYENFPDYSLTVFMFSHEMGHNLGSRHTHWCGWANGAIDNCAAVEGSCDPGPSPSNQGTIMSYCHLNGQPGINFSEGFGPEPGNKIRSIISAKTCDKDYYPEESVSCTPNNIISANRECTDEDDWTHYYYDNNTTDKEDDYLLLSVLKGNENIGNLDDGTLVVQIKTSTNAGNGATHIEHPGYNTGEDWYVMNRWFELIPTTQPSNPVTVRFPYTTDDLMDVMISQPSVSKHEDLIFYKINAPKDPNPDNGHTDVSNADITFYNNSSGASLSTWEYGEYENAHFAEFKVSSFSGGGGGFSQSSQSSLPVEIIKFDVERNEDYAIAKWETALEINNDFFTVERSSDGKNFSEIGRIKGLGNSARMNEYSFLDRNPTSGINYYRLSQTDFDGTHVNLGVRSINMDFIREINIFPNPLDTDNLNINYTLTNTEDISVIIRNIEGRMVYNTNRTSDAGENVMNLDLSQLNAGMYIVQILSNNESYTQKLIKD